MALATLEQIRDRVLNEKDSMKKQDVLRSMKNVVEMAEGTYTYDYWSTPAPVRYSNSLAEKFLAATREQWEKHSLGKGPRPWNVTKITKNLDPAAVWIGMEYETGFKNPQAYLDGVNELWNNHNNVAMDGEGYGAHFAEITFSPVTLSDFNSDTYNVDRMIATDLLMPYEERHGEWGLHVNFSTPEMRSNWTLTSDISCVLHNSLVSMTFDERREVFGRNPYGSFEPRNDSTDQFNWIEGKLFCTTTDPDMWQAYKHRINNLVKIVQSLVSRDRSTWQYKAVRNFHEMLLCDDANDVELELGNTDAKGYLGRDEDFEYEYEECDCYECRADRGDD